ncbi:hypothetical protein J6590_084594 [Homalodisca vitripennis]|nr:hypothetical protein J6590_084594 [Homalodisca vitripennis]
MKKSSLDVVPNGKEINVSPNLNTGDNPIDNPLEKRRNLVVPSIKIKTATPKLAMFQNYPSRQWTKGPRKDPRRP